MKDLLFKNVEMEAFEKNIDLDLNEGGAGWNKLRAKSFSARVSDIANQAEALDKDYKQALPGFADYLLRVFDLKMQPEIKARLIAFLRLRLENKIDAFGVQERLDAPVSVGGVGLYKNTSEKMMREIEMVMLLKYSA